MGWPVRSPAQPRQRLLALAVALAVACSPAATNQATCISRDVNVAKDLEPMGNIGGATTTGGDEVRGFKVYGITPGDRSGWSVSDGGDVNADGYSDLLVGAIYAVGNYTCASECSGEAYVVYGQANMPRSIDLSQLDGSNGFTINGLYDGNNGASVSSAGDVNGDGFDDIAVGAAGPEKHNTGEGYVVYGRGTMPAVVNLADDLDGTNGFKINGVGQLDLNTQIFQHPFKNAVSGAGDVNKDGFDDIIVSANKRVYVLYGGASDATKASRDLTALDGTDGFAFIIPEGHPAGYAVAAAGDFNGDGFGDVVIGASYATARDGTTNVGVVYVVYGASAMPREVEASGLDARTGLVFHGTFAGGFAGEVVAGGGDVNGDGLPDVVIGATQASKNPSVSDPQGQTYVVFGSRLPPKELSVADLDGSNGFVVNGAATGDYSGSAVNIAGDINGDGYADFVIGAKNANRGTNRKNAGEAYVVFGRASTPKTINLRVYLEGNPGRGFKIGGGAANDYLGGSVGGADVNGDGLADVVIGAYGAGSRAGEVYVVLACAPAATLPDTNGQPDDTTTATTATTTRRTFPFVPQTIAQPDDYGDYGERPDHAAPGIGDVVHGTTDSGCAAHCEAHNQRIKLAASLEGSSSVGTQQECTSYSFNEQGGLCQLVGDGDGSLARAPACIAAEASCAASIGQAAPLGCCAGTVCLPVATGGGSLVPICRAVVSSFPAGPEPKKKKDGGSSGKLGRVSGDPQGKAGRKAKSGRKKGKNGRRGNSSLALARTGGGEGKGKGKGKGRKQPLPSHAAAFIADMATEAPARTVSATAVFVLVVAAAASVLYVKVRRQRAAAPAGPNEGAAVVAAPSFVVV